MICIAGNDIVKSSSKGVSIKDVRSQMEGGCPVRTFCRQEGISDANDHPFLVQKTSDF